MEGCIKPIDILTKLIDPSDDVSGIEINEPYMILKGLAVKKMEELHGDLKIHLDNSETDTHIRYWKALLVVSEWELAEALKRDTLERAAVRGEQLPPEMIGEERGLHASIEPKIKNLLNGNTYNELETLQSCIESQMRSGTAKVLEYWAAVLKLLHVYKAKACLRDIHAKMLRKHLEYLETPLLGEYNKKERSPEFDRQNSDQDIEELNCISNALVYLYLRLSAVNNLIFVEPEALSPVPAVMNMEDQDDEVDEGSYSPQRLHGDEDEDKCAMVNPEEDKAILERRRIAKLKERRAQEMASMSTRAQQVASRPTPP